MTNMVLANRLDNINHAVRLLLEDLVGDDRPWSHTLPTLRRLQRDLDDHAARLRVDPDNEPP